MKKVLPFATFFLPPQEQGIPIYWSGMGEEIKSTPRYRWDGLQRGNEMHLIWQLTLGGQGWIRIGDREPEPLPQGRGFMGVFPSDHCYFYKKGDPAWHFIWVSWTGPAIEAVWKSMSAAPMRIIRMDALSSAVNFVRSRTNFRSMDVVGSRQDSVQAYRLLMNISEQESSLSNGSVGTGKKEIVPQLGRVLQKAPGLSVGKDGLATRVKLSRFQLYRSMKREVGMSPKEWTLQQRLNKAIHLLKTTDAPIADVASMSGMADANYFARFFRKHTGFSPKNWRELFASRKRNK